MQVIHTACAGLDVHKKTVVSCALLSRADGQVQSHCRSFGTTTPQILALADWLKGLGVTHVVMESTGVYWRPIYQLLEGSFTLLLVNAAHVKAVPGRKTDLNDAQWLAELLRHGLLRPSFVPPKAQRQVRELTRHRSNLAAKRAQAINELHRTLEGTNVKLTSVATDITGVSATLMLEQLLAGQSDPKALAQLAMGRLRQKRVQLAEALQGKVEAHHKLILSQLLVDIDLFDEQIEQTSAEIEQRLQREEQLIQRLDVIPGVNRRVAEVLLAELGTDMGRFGSAERAAAWSGLCPGNRQSGGRRYATRSRKGNRPLKGALCQAGQAAGRSRDSYLGAQYRRIASRRGSKRAALAAGHSILKISYHMIARGTEYKDLGPDYFDRRNKDAVKRRLVERLEKLGYQVQVKEPTSTH